jgi:hypothetical protein
MLFSSRTTIGLFFILAGLASSAPASTMYDFRTFDGSNVNVEGTPIASISGPAATVTPRGFLVTGSPDDAIAYQTPFGLGIQDVTALPVVEAKPNGSGPNVFLPGTWSKTNTFHVDGRNGGEFLRLEFSAPVRLLNACFALIGPYDQYGVAVAGETPTTFFNISSMGDVAFPDLPFATAFDLHAPAWNSSTSSFSEWNLQKLEVEVIPEASSLAVWAILAMAAFAVVHFRSRLRRTELSAA